MAMNSRAASAPSQDLLTRALSLRLGLEFVGERALTPDEIAELEREAQKYQKQSTFFGWLTILVFASPFLLGLLGSALFPDGANPRYDRITDLLVGFVLVPLISTSVLFGVLYDEGQRRGKQGLGWDLRDGVALQFQGRADRFKDRRFATKFFAENSVVSSTETLHLVEVLPHAQRLWKIDGVVVAPWKVLDKVPRLAPPTGVVIDEVLASSFPEALKANIPAEVVGERELTSIESKELEYQLKNSSISTWFFRTGLTLLLMFSGQVLVDYFFFNKPLFFPTALMIVPAVCFLLGVLTIPLSQRANHRLRQDLAERRMMKVHIPTSPQTQPTSQRQGIDLEILPNTRWILTSQEQLPRWRAKSKKIKSA